MEGLLAFVLTISGGIARVTLDAATNDQSVDKRQTSVDSLRSCPVVMNRPHDLLRVDLGYFTMMVSLSQRTVRRAGRAMTRVSVCSLNWPVICGFRPANHFEVSRSSFSQTPSQQGCRASEEKVMLDWVAGLNQNFVAEINSQNERLEQERHVRRRN